MGGLETESNRKVRQQNMGLTKNYRISAIVRRIFRLTVAEIWYSNLEKYCQTMACLETFAGLDILIKLN